MFTGFPVDHFLFEGSQPLLTCYSALLVFFQFPNWLHSFNRSFYCHYSKADMFYLFIFFTSETMLYIIFQEIATPDEEPTTRKVDRRYQAVKLTSYLGDVEHWSSKPISRHFGRLWPGLHVLTSVTSNRSTKIGNATQVSRQTLTVVMPLLPATGVQMRKYEKGQYQPFIQPNGYFISNLFSCATMNGRTFICPVNSITTKQLYTSLNWIWGTMSFIG